MYSRRRTKLNYALQKKPPENCERIKQTHITDFFKSLPVVNRKLSFDKSTKSMARISAEIFPDSFDDNSDLPADMNILPYPFSDDDTSDSENIKNSMKNKKMSAKSVGGANGTSTMIGLNRPSTSNTKPEEIPVTFTPLKKINTRTPISMNKSPKSEKCTILGNATLTRKKTHNLTFDYDQSYEEETTPYKRTKMETPSNVFKIEIELGIKVDGTPILDIPVAQKQLSIMKEHSSAFDEKKMTTNPSSSSTSKNTHPSPKLPKIKLRENGPPQSAIKLKPEKDDEKLNFTRMEVLKTLFEEILKNNDKKKLLTMADIEVIEDFSKLDVCHQYFLIELFLDRPIWHSMIEFCNKIKLNQKLTAKEITTMYEYHKNNRFVYTDITQLSLVEMLKIPNNKRKMDNDFKKKCDPTMELSEGRLKEEIYKYLGPCVQLKTNIISSFDKVYVLQTYSNFSYCMDIKNYLKDMCNGVLYPEYLIEEYTVFKNKDQFLRFYEALKVKQACCENEKKDDAMKIHCNTAFKKLQSIDDGKWQGIIPDHLQQFSPEYQYISVLKSSIKNFTKYFEDGKVCLEFLIKTYPTSHAVGSWYHQLAHIILHNDKNYEYAAQIIIRAFELNEKENIFDLLQIYELNLMAHKIITTKSYNVCPLYCHKLAVLANLTIDINNFPSKPIEGCTEVLTEGKRIYKSPKNELISGSMEDIALKSYTDYEGIHCGGKFITILFSLLFWDIIYEYYVPMAFISKLQSVPLDMYGNFYEHRKKEIDERLEDISSKWPDENLKRFLKDNWKNHSHELSITDFEGPFKELSNVLIMFHCIERTILSKILGRLVSDYKLFRNGFPDLFLWNVEFQKCKFVEAIRKNDTLQPNQILWIQHLLEIKAEVEICNVSGNAVKKAKTKDDK